MNPGATTSRYEYDSQADALYIYFSENKYAFGEDLDRERRVDYDRDSTPVGVELLCVSSGVSLANLPNQQEIEKVLKKLKIKALV